MYDLTEREFELYLEGYRDRIDHAMDVLAWMQANLINIHIPKNKPRVTVDKLRPKKRRSGPGTEDEGPTAAEMLELEMAFDTPADAKERARAAGRMARQRAMERELDEESRRFWESDEGRRLEALLREE